MPTAVVVGADVNGLGLVRSLGQAGVPVVVIDRSRWQPAMFSRHSRPVVVGGFDGRLVEALCELAESCASPPVVLSTNDDASQAVLQAHDMLGGRLRLRLPTAEMMSELSTKEGFKRRAEALGAPVPRSRVVRGEGDLATLDALVPPLVLKPNRRDEAYDGRFAKAYHLHGIADAVALCRRILPVYPHLVVQEWIEGANHDIHFCLQYLSPERVTSFTGRKLRSWPPQTGVTASCVAAPEAAAELEAVTTDFFRRCGVLGLASMEYKRDRRSGRFLMVEPTVGRTNWQQEIATLCGVNLPLVAYCDLAGLPAPVVRPRRGEAWRDGVSDWRSVLRSGDRTRFPADCRIHDAYWRRDDPLPAVVAYGRLGARAASALGRASAAHLGGGPRRQPAAQEGAAAAQIER